MIPRLKFYILNSIWLLVLSCSLVISDISADGTIILDEEDQIQDSPRDDTSLSSKSCYIGSEHGTCMFVWECLKTDRKHLGMCMDGFMFGSCCGFKKNPADDSGISDAFIAQPDPMETNLQEGVSSGIPSVSENLVDDGLVPGGSDVQSNQLGSIEEEPQSQDVHQKYKPTVSSTSLEDEGNLWSSYPTRPSRPTKPTVHWQHLQLLHQQTSTTTTSTTSRTIAVRPIATRPTKRPPQFVTSFKTTSRPSWGWESDSSRTDTMTTTPMTTTVTMTTTPRTTTSYFPSSSSDESNEIQYRQKTTNHPTRPTRPPKIPTVETINYFPQASDLQSGNEGVQEVNVNKIVSWKPTPFTTTSTTTTTQSTTTTTSYAPVVFQETPLTQQPTVQFQPPPRSSTHILATPNPHVPIVENNQPTGGCGVPVLNHQCPKGRIVNGTQSCYGQFPWQVSVRRTSFFGFSSTHRCGGALINELWVATAGHCVDDLAIQKIRVRIGEWDFSSTSEPQGSVELKVIDKIVHPKYNFFTYEYDLALVKLERRITFQENMIPICLPGNDDSLVGEVGIVAGWGRLSEGGQLPNILQYVSVPIVSNTKCKEMFLRANRHEVIPEIFMCAGYDDGGRDSCQGDSGGPLVVKGVDGRYFLGGIISWGIGCAEPNLPGVCTRISKFTEWILDQVT